MNLSMLNNDWIKSTVSLLVGWFLNAASPYITEQRERRKAISSALSDLLEIRHRFVSIESGFNALINLVPLPPDLHPGLQPQIEALLRTKIASLMPDSQELSKRYNDSVSLVASSDPLLGFHLRSKDTAQPMFATLNSIVVQTQDMHAAAFLKLLNPIFLKEAEKGLSAMILELARRRGWWTCRKVRKLLASSSDISQGQRDVIDLVKKEIQKHVEQPPVQSPPSV